MTLEGTEKRFETFEVNKKSFDFAKSEGQLGSLVYWQLKGSCGRKLRGLWNLDNGLQRHASRQWKLTEIDKLVSR